MLDYAALARRMAECYPGNKIGAIQMVRETANLGLAEAKELVDGLWEDLDGFEGEALAAEIAIWVKEEIQLRAPHPGRVQAAPARTHDWPRELAQFFPNRKIEAIKYVRERTGLGLKEAKDLVEQQWTRVKADGVSVSTGESMPEYEVRPSGFPWVWVVLVVAAALAAWFLTR